MCTKKNQVNSNIKITTVPSLLYPMHHLSLTRDFNCLFQVSFDLGTLYFYQEKFQQAMKMFESCKNAQVFYC